MIEADLSVESALIASGHRCVVGMDEVGRGALAGPAAVGVAAVSAEVVAEGSLARVPGLTDSKQLSAGRREVLVPQIRAWIPTAVGTASPTEIDEHGITGALRLAGCRALAALAQVGMEHPVDVVLLDGSCDWLSSLAADLFESPEEGLDDAVVPPWRGPVTTRVKADLGCASVAAASIIAKVERDALMRRLDDVFPGYGWAGNKGYGTAAHRRAISQHGPSPWHRLTWTLGAEPEKVEAARAQRAGSGLNLPG